MSECTEHGDQLAPYVDGELEAATAEAFALHLADCAICRAALHDALQLAALEARAQRGAPARQAAPRPSRDRVRRWNQRSKLAAAGAVIALAAAAVVVVGLRGGGGVALAPVAPAVLATAETRSIEGRVSYAAADRYRRYSVVRAAGPAAPSDAISLDTLARLEQRGDLHGVAAGYLLLGDPARATAYLERAPASADVAADRGFVLLATGHPAEALIALDGVLERVPRHPQALWNRALALRDLGLVRLAAAAFETAAAAAGDPGWADEARARAKALADEAAARSGRLDRLVAAGPRLATVPDGVPAELAREVPGTTRLYFYDAVRAAATADAVRALAPLARTLDAVAGDHVLAAYVDRTARADFTRRGPLATRYAALVAGAQLDDAATRGLLAQLRAAGQADILLGALIWTGPGRNVAPALLAEYRRLADAAADPWFAMLATEQEARAAIDRGQPEAVELPVRAALQTCRTLKLEFRCIRLALVLGESYLAVLRLVDARRVLGDGSAMVERSGEWFLEQAFLSQRADLEMLADDVSASTLPLARAYLGELELRDPRCTTQIWSREQLAILMINREQLGRARELVAEVLALEASCPAATASPRGVFVKAQVATDAQVAAVRAQIARARAAATRPGVEAFLDQVEGRLLIDRDRRTGAALLERAIAAGRDLPRSDVDGHKARSYAYTLLALDAGRAAEWPRVWQLLGDETGLTVERCGLGLAIEGRRSVVVARGATGAIAGAYDDARQGPELDGSHLVPVMILRQLDGCAEIDVIARPPSEGLPGLLPGELAWSYRARKAPVSDPGHAAAPPGTSRLVIANTQPPAEIGVPRLLPWTSRTSPDVLLEGAAATPSRALAALADAGFVEIHAHGTVNPAVSDAAFLMLSPEPDGRYALTAADLRKQPLRGKPVVVLAACHAGATASYRHERWGLPAAFVEAGARAVIASPEVIEDADAGGLFDDVRARIERGASVAVALRDARTEWLHAHPQAGWVRSLMVFR